MMKIYEIAWLAGLFEGEGYFGLQRGHVWISIEMTDKDVVQRVRDLISPGRKIEIRDNSHKNGKVSYRLWVSGKDNIEEILYSIYPFMGERRKSRIDRLLSKIEEQRRRKEYFDKETEEIKRLYATGKITQEFLGKMFGITGQGIRYRLSL